MLTQPKIDPGILADGDSTPASSPAVRRAAIAGLFGPVLFALGLVAITWAEWDYLRRLGFSLTDHGDSAWPSGLAQGPVGWAQIANYALLGLLLLVFFHGLRSQFPSRRARRVAAVLLTGSALAWVLLAFPEDGPPFGDPSTWAGFLHAVGFVLLVFCTTSAMVATGVALHGNPAWRTPSRVSFVAAAATFFFLVVLVFALEVATTLGVYGFFATILAWVEFLAFRLHRQATD